MIMNVDTNCDIAATFIARWQPSGGKELANYQSFLIELCTLLGVAPPEPTTTDDRHNAYVFERSVPSVKIDVVLVSTGLTCTNAAVLFWKPSRA